MNYGIKLKEQRECFWWMMLTIESIWLSCLKLCMMNCQKDEMNFQKEIEDGMAATDILDRVLALMRNEMEHSEDSLSLAMYEYSGTCSNDRMNYFNRIGEKKWSDLIEYGIVRGEFNTVNVKEIVHVILYAYQGVRMWSRIVSMTPEVYDSITNHIRKQLIKEQ